MGSRMGFMENFQTVHPLAQTLIATGFTWGMTAMGALVVFLFRQVPKNVLEGMLGFASGVMIAASFWSLLAPSIELSEALGLIKWVPPLLGFLAGSGFLWFVDRLIPHLHFGLPLSSAEGFHTRWKKTVLLVLAITLHNIPEGLAVGVAFGSSGLGAASLSGAVSLAFGIGLQNFPEGVAVSVPLYGEGLPVFKSFFIGQLSGLVEPIAGLIGASAVLHFRPILPYALAFAAGAMMYVVVEELIPESQRSRHSDVATVATILGFAIMMTLDVALG